MAVCTLSSSTTSRSSRSRSHADFKQVVEVLRSTKQDMAQKKSPRKTSLSWMQSRATVCRRELPSSLLRLLQWTDYPKTVLMHIISQLRPGADLSRVTLPTFILEPRSMLERITKYGSQSYTSDGRC